MVSKKDAGYTKAKTSQKDAGYVTGEKCYCCGTCKFFIPSGSCQIVNGNIIFHGCCNFWKKGKKGLTCCSKQEEIKKLLKC